MKYNNVGLKIGTNYFKLSALNHEGDTIINCLYCDKR
jgi:hypothetical protein